jgi:hypothetical protein
MELIEIVKVVVTAYFVWVVLGSLWMDIKDKGW